MRKRRILRRLQPLNEKRFERRELPPELVIIHRRWMKKMVEEFRKDLPFLFQRETHAE